MTAFFEIETDGENSGHCDCCGNQTQTVWGYVYKQDACVAAYWVHWTVGASLADHPTNFDLIYGTWGEGAKREDRKAISLIYFENENGPGVTVIDAAIRPFAKSRLHNHAMTRNEVLGTEFAAEVFAIFDTVLLNDPRLQA